MAINPQSLSPGRELAVLATMRRVSARSLAQRAGLSYWRTARILADRARPSHAELASLRDALFNDEAAAT